MYLVSGIPTPLKHMSSSVEMMTFPTEWKNELCVPVTTNQMVYPMVQYIKKSPSKNGISNQVSHGIMLL